MFLDEILIKVEAGRGGDGSTSFRREKFIAMGGPDGGQGGRGSDIIFVADESLTTLIDFNTRKLIKGENGQNGSGKNQTGRSAENIEIKVPIGTSIYNSETGELIADLINHNEKAIIAKGGRGGRGNKSFASNRNKAPKTSEKGQPGEKISLKLELKLIADVGLVGFPSVGKSTILNMISNSKSKVGAYHFTTLSPNLGVVKVYDSSFVMADLPGLIKGASEGIGLGFKFLKHASRVKVIAHVIDMGSSEGRDPLKDYEMIRKELVKYDKSLADKKEIIIANKMDLDSAQENLEKFKAKHKNTEIFEVTAILNEGFDDLLIHLNKVVKEVKESYKTHKTYTFKEEKDFTIHKEDGRWIVKGEKVENKLKMTRFEDEEGTYRFARYLKNAGVYEELLNKGAKYGDEVQILSYLFDFTE